MEPPQHGPVQYIHSVTMVWYSSNVHSGVPIANVCPVRVRCGEDIGEGERVEAAGRPAKAESVPL